MVLALLCLAGIVACSSDDLTDDNATATGKQVQVTLNIGVQEPESVTRADDGNSVAGENMYSWFVIVAKDGKVVEIVSSGSVTDLETDNVTLTTTLTEGATYDFYSFANIDRSSISALSGLSVDSEMPTMTDLTFALDGNGFDINSNHIPMSNHQQITIPASGEVSLWVVRMLAKIELDFTNSIGDDIKITSITLSDVTTNATTTDAEGNSSATSNLKLLPNPTLAGETGACTPNLVEGVATADYTYTPAAALSLSNGGTGNLTFYVNESATPTNNFGLFILTVSFEDSNGNASYQRYTLISNDDSNWNYIARNDYRVIPITLQEYALEVLAYDWPPIGVYPASVNYEPDLFSVTFHTAGHFHLVPTVTKYGSTTPLTYSDAGNDATDDSEYWSYVSFTDAQTVPDGFYATDASTIDACDNGGAPVWDATNHFIFGYLADDTEDESSTETSGNVSGESSDVTKAYHDLTITVHTGSTSATRTLTYHLCIVKDLAY